MKKRLLLLGVCLLAGCGDADLPVQSSPHKTVDAKKLAEAKQQFSAFLDEAAQGAALLESHPDRDAIAKQIKALEELLNRASRVYPSHEKMAELAEQSRGLMKYFDACVGIANYQSKQKDVTAEVAKKRVDWTCDENARAIRQVVNRLRGLLGP
jgi:hypothetical protein